MEVACGRGRRDGEEGVGGEAGEVERGTSMKSEAGYMEREEPEALEELGHIQHVLAPPSCV